MTARNFNNFLDELGQISSIFKISNSYGKRKEYYICDPRYITISGQGIVEFKVEYERKAMDEYYISELELLCEKYKLDLIYYDEYIKFEYIAD